MNNTIVVPRAFGGTLIITLSSQSTLPTLQIQAVFRDGNEKSVHRDGNIPAGGR